MVLSAPPPVMFGGTFSLLSLGNGLPNDLHDGAGGEVKPPLTAGGPALPIHALLVRRAG